MKYDIILATTPTLGIAFQGKLPWNIPEEMKIFRDKTENNILIVGRKTYDTLPKLKNRTIYVLTNEKLDPTMPMSVLLNDSNVIFVNSLDEIPTSDKTTFIAGGSHLYNCMLHPSNHPSINLIHYSLIHDLPSGRPSSTEPYECDVKIKYNPLDGNAFTLVSQEEHKEFTHYVLKPNKSEDKGEMVYINLLRKILEQGNLRTSRSGDTIGVFGETLTFDLSGGLFPLLTTKKMFFRGIVEELLFFIRGDTNSNLLEEKKVNIWKGNTSLEFLDKNNFPDREEGMMGPMYGYQWRSYGAKYDEKSGRPKKPKPATPSKFKSNDGFDQLSEVIHLLKTDPYSRRIMMTTYNPLQAKQGVLYPCHGIVSQFYVEESEDDKTTLLSMYYYCRSSDTFLGLPFNIASSALLLILVSKLVNMKPNKLIMGLGDCHIYKEHINSCFTQINRVPYSFPKLKINKDISSIKDIENMKYEDFELIDYMSYSALKGEMKI